jgi:hypothetical protein
MVAQLFASAREIGPFGVRLRTYRHILTGGIDMAPATRPAVQVIETAFCVMAVATADDQAGSRKDAVVGREWGLRTSHLRMTALAVAGSP